MLPAANMIDKGHIKVLHSPGYNFVFDRKTGFFARWGETKDDDPDFSPYGPEILDLEISTGECKGRCRFCYKANGTLINETKHMTTETFEAILDKMPKTLTQIAFGITDVYGNPDFFEMMVIARHKGIIPNYTTHGLDMDDTAADLTSKLCGAVAVSVVNKEKTFDTVKMLTDRGMTQVNIHFMISAERMEAAHKLVDEIKTDPRLANLNAVVFLQYKPKGNNTDSFSCPSLEQFKGLVEHCEGMGVRFGFDSCTAPMYEQAIADRPNAEEMLKYAEPCESSVFSSYINADGDFFPCSFCEGQPGWETGLSVVDCDNFIDDIWYHGRIREWRLNLWSNCRACPMYDLGDGMSKPMYQLNVSTGEVERKD